MEELEEIFELREEIKRKKCVREIKKQIEEKYLKLL